MVGFALGDHTVNIGLSALSLLYLYFLSEVAGLRPALASLVLLVGRGVDAVFDPIMGRLSDLTRWRMGRRRPYFLIAAVPFGVSFATLWLVFPIGSQWAEFTVYALLYILHSLSSSMLTVPYMALLPELAADYHERTRLNAYRQVGSVLGTLVAAMAMRPLVEWFGGGTVGFAWAGVILGVWMTIPWALVYAITWEQDDHPPVQTSFLTGMRRALTHRTYQRLLGIFISSRMAIDLSGAMFVFYLTYRLHRPNEFPLVMGLLLLTGTLSLPFWLRLARRIDKARAYLIGIAIWGIALVGIQFQGVDWPPWCMWVLVAVAGFGFAAGDLMPWAMLGDVIDEDELLHGERRDGIYAGVFTFLRKLGGAAAVAIGGQMLDLAGFEPGQIQSEEVVETIRFLTAGLPAVLLVVGAVTALRYPLGRARHEEILNTLVARKEAKLSSVTARGELRG